MTEFSERELDQRVKEFFLKNPAGKQLLSRWESRINRIKDELVTTDDSDKVKMLQAKIRYHKEVMTEIL